MKITELNVGDKELAMEKLKIQIKDFYHVSEYGTYFSLNVIVSNELMSREYNEFNPFNFGSYHFELIVLDFSQAKLIVRNLKVGDQFIMRKGESIFMPSEDLLIELVGQTDNYKNQIEYSYKLTKAGKFSVEKIIQYYKQPALKNIPPGKNPAENRYIDRSKSNLKIVFEDYALENVINYENLNERNSYVFRVNKVSP